MNIHITLSIIQSWKDELIEIEQKLHDLRSRREVLEKKIDAVKLFIDLKPGEELPDGID